tara:strand:- start:31 stop:549 length:519 start_codon:yes stop_codon:yes gene_type:complete
MAIIYGYPIGTPTAKDNLLGTQVNPTTEENKTVQFPIGSVGTLLTQGYLETTVALTAVQLNALQATDVQLIAAPGANQYIRVLNASFYFDYIAPQYTFAASPTAEIGAVDFFTVPGNRLSGAADIVHAMTLVAGDIAANTPLMLKTGGTVTGNGNGTLQIKIRYQILDTSAF